VIASLMFMTLQFDPRIGGPIRETRPSATWSHGPAEWRAKC